MTTKEKIFHVSEDGGIKLFKPRPSPSKFDNINGEVIFGVSETLVHTYLLPRDCPRVCYYAKKESLPADKKRFLNPPAEFVIAIEKKWLPVIKQTTLYLYEFDKRFFSLLDECAGYYISYRQVKPLSVKRIDDPLKVLSAIATIEIRVLPTLWDLADEIKQSSLNFSLIRMRNAATRDVTG